MHSITNKTSERPVKFGTLFCLALKSKKCGHLVAPAQFSLHKSFR